MLRLRLKNPAPSHLTHYAPFPFMSAEYPLKPRVHGPTRREFQVVCLPQRDGSFVASVVEDPKIVVYDKSRIRAEEKASKKFLRTPDPYAYRNHPLAVTKAVTIDMEFDEESNSFVTCVKELHRMSTFGKTELDTLNNTTEMIRGYIQSMEANRKKIPLPSTKLAELKRLVGIR
jgi:predicted RNase H-like HicB family nuclease